MSQAKLHLEKSVDEGYIEGIKTLADAYHGVWFDLGVPYNLAMTKILYKKAAGMGDEEAIFIYEVSSLTEGFAGTQRNFQLGVRKAQQLANGGNQVAVEWIKNLHCLSEESLIESDGMTEDDFVFLEEFLNWTR
jgi:TPR repeat protein